MRIHEDSFEHPFFEKVVRHEFNSILKKIRPIKLLLRRLVKTFAKLPHCIGYCCHPLKNLTHDQLDNFVQINHDPPVVFH